MEKFLGRSFTPEKIKEATAALEQEREMQRTPIPGEIEKDKLVLGLLQEVNFCLRKEFERLSIGSTTEIPPEQVHILPQQVMKEQFPGMRDDEGGRYSGIRGICINKDHPNVQNPAFLFLELLHETLHSLAYNSYRLTTDEEEFYEYRRGYRHVNIKSQKGIHQHFASLDEAVTQKAMYEIASNSRKEYAGPLKSIRHRSSSYKEEVAILELIISKIAKTKREPLKTVWERFEKGYFTGEMMHLRDIEKVCGRGSLMLLDILDFFRSFPEKVNKDIKLQVLSYFETNKKNIKEKILNNIIKEKETYV